MNILQLGEHTLSYKSLFPFFENMCKQKLKSLKPKLNLCDFLDSHFEVILLSYQQTFPYNVK